MGAAARARTPPGGLFAVKEGKMRLTFRVLLASLRAIESSFDEIASALRGTAYRDDAIKAARALRVARTEINAVLDRMGDDSYGE